MAALVLDFSSIDASMVPLVGGKAANLGELTQAGLPVPGGFCLTVGAYRRVVADVAALGSVLDQLEGPGQADPGELATLAGKAREAVVGAPVPADIEAEVVRSYTALGTDVPVAVRSSATAEDLPFASFAGQQDTYLNVVGVPAVLDAVRRCWASLWTDRAVSYRVTNNIVHREVALAVVVQRMVNSQVSGVLFTANPVTGRRREAVVDASPGLGEAVVSGAVNPDHFVLGLDGGPVRERRLGDKRIEILSVAGGGTVTRERPAEAEPVACLTDAQLVELAALGRQVEDHYGAPRDCEWALDSSATLWLTQARPITTLFPLPTDPGPAGDGSAAYFNFTLAQGLMRPITPMGLSAFRVLSGGLARFIGAQVPDLLAGPRVVVTAGQRAFFDITGAITHPLGRRVLVTMFGVMEARAAAVVRELGEDPRFAVRKISARRLVTTVAKAALRLRVPPRVLVGVLSPERALRAADRAARRWRDDLAAPAGISAEQRLDHVQGVLSRNVTTVMPGFAPAPAAGFLMLALAGRLLRGALEPGEVEAVLRGLPHNVTTEMDLALWALVGRARADAPSAEALAGRTAEQLATAYRSGELPPVLRDGMAGFLAEYGHRAVAEIDLGLPRWSEDPAHLFGVLTNYLRLDNPDLAPDVQFAKAVRGAEQAVATLVAKARRRGRLRALVVRIALRRTRLLAGMREAPKYYLVVGLAAARTQLLQVGAELATAGRLDAAEDVFFLDLAEARRALRGADPRELVAARRVDYDRELRRRQLPRVLLSDGTEPEAVATARTAGDAVDGQLAGTPASSGTVTGIARVVLEPVGAHLEPGEILVAPSTDPGWTPLFLTAGGLVMEMGGSNSHGAVVAREYGIPAVVGVPNATHLIKDGDRIEVRGAEGRVIIA
ncbi:MAG TPA: PEP/pyruvate-binding domain-containing protein [Pseudonocardia sp.]|jgi:pyruvate,water dikinase|nr:PEP/pyruvate-binding domain-containing protein [Pseudonocardia sp.]